MKRIAIILTLFTSLTTCGQDNVYPGDILSDSLEFSQKDRADIYIISKKKNLTTVTVKTLDGQEISKTPLTTEHENKITIADLDRGIYMIEAYDKTGLVLRDRFIKK